MGAEDSACVCGVKRARMSSQWAMLDWRGCASEEGTGGAKDAREERCAGAKRCGKGDQLRQRGHSERSEHVAHSASSRPFLADLDQDRFADRFGQSCLITGLIPPGLIQPKSGRQLAAAAL